jgi:hypothetical protein
MSDQQPNEPQRLSVDRALLVEANWLLREGHRMVAVLTAIQACEVVMACAVRRRLDEKGLAELYPALRESVGGFDLRNPSACQLYETMTGHMIRPEAQQQGLWSPMMKALERADKLVFGGVELSQEDARASIDAATRIAELVGRRNKL